MAMLTFRSAARSDIGSVRATNEDAVFVSPRIVAVADGVGGAAAGEVASATAINAVAHVDKCVLADPLPVALRRTVAEANEAIAFVTDCRPSLAGMATTLVAVAVDGAEYVVTNVGDSRAYLLRDRQLRRLTRDDSYVQELVDSGHLTEREARVHPQRSVVTEALDGRPKPRATITTRSARPGDRVLVCSDGLTDLVGEGDLHRALAIDDLRTCTATLVDLALTAGGRDNVTVAVADVSVCEDPALTWS